MNKVCIGIPIHAEPERLPATLESVRANTSAEFQLVLLPDGPDHATARLLADLPEIPQLATSEPRGGAACFNRLALYDDADAIVLLESGALVGPGWLDHLLAALRADPQNGLAGPSTNRSWNEQAIFTSSEPAPADFVRAAFEANRRYGISVRTLEPLYSLADFCYAVRREVIEAIGSADEGYGLGPCWEMDYNVRAARAGWRGVWACAAYVHRAPFTLRRQRDETRFFESSKRRYQDKFCGARLRGDKFDYRVHCHGDACPNFAPAHLIELMEAPASLLPHEQTAEAPSRLATVQLVAEEPLASCIMPTCNRLGFVPEAVRCFSRQDYPNRELVIVDDGTDPVDPMLPKDVRLRLIRLNEKKTVGAKRNIACASARGEFIVHWDDDDWYPPDRIGRQVAAIRADSRLQISGTSTLFFYDSATNRAWRYRYQNSGRPWVAGTTLAYRKSWWSGHPFSEIQVGEDSRFVWAAPGNAVYDLATPALCVSRIHSGNTCRKQTVGAYWQQCSVAELASLLGEEWPLFLCVGNLRDSRDSPLVSCIMPTFNRRSFLPLALHSFNQQDYLAKELIVVDDGTDCVGDLVENVPDTRYLRLPTRASIGEKRNRACATSRGAIIVHWDDDDWYAPSRLRNQVAPLLSGQADITGLENSCLLELPIGKFWRTRSWLHRRMFAGDVHGGTLAYWKQLILDGLQYPAINLAEDAAFILAALRAQKRLLRLPNDGIFVYVRHGNNAWRFQPGHFLDPAGWETIPAPPGFSTELLSAYCRAATESL
jgi:O-antigen biosynthesis protein